MVNTNWDVTIGNDTFLNGSLAPNETMTGTASYTIKLSDLVLGSVMNTAQAYAEGVYSNTVYATVAFEGTLF